VSFPRAGRSGSTRRQLLRRIAFALAGTILVVVVIAAAIVLRPYPADGLRAGAGTALVVSDRRGSLLRIVPTSPGAAGVDRWVPLDQIAPEVVLATIAGEDRRFFSHPGVDLRAVVRAVGQAIRARRVISGASTITMQLARTLDPHPRTLLGKLGEVLDALRIERALGKAAILEQYLNRIYYGSGASGIEAAARSQFGKSAATLGPGEATLLAVLPRAPSAYDPRRHLPAALARRAHVLAALERAGTIAAGDRRRIENAPLVFARPAPAPAMGEAPHFVDWVLAQLTPAQRRLGGPLRTTLDLDLQHRLEFAVQRQLDAQPAHGQAGVVVLDPKSGAVRAMVGSPDFAADDAGQVNITTAARHPGSTLKPFIYALAIEAGASPASLAEDSLAGSPGYHPGRRIREHGRVRYREALAGSFNLAAVDVLGDVGVARLLERLRVAGVGPLPGTASAYGLDLALGAARVRLVDLAAAYAAFVADGQVQAPHGWSDATPVTTQLFSPATSWLVMDMLADPDARRAAFGSALPFDLPFKVAAKTGTSSGFADTLAIAATREAVVAAWAGAFDGSGTRGKLAMWSAAPLARAALLALADLSGAPLTLPPQPPGIVARDVCRVTGELPGDDCPTKRERFAAGSIPQDRCRGHGLSVPPADRLESAVRAAAP
jgi:penicillin-binding protein 1C